MEGSTIEPLTYPDAENANENFRYFRQPLPNLRRRRFGTSAPPYRAEVQKNKQTGANFRQEIVTEKEHR